MNWLDIGILLIMFFSVFAAAKKGFSREMIGLIATLFALVLGLWLYGTAGAWLHPFVSSVGVANFVGFLLVFIGVLIVGGLLGALVGRFLSAAGLSWLDRALGAAFGIARGILASVALVLILTAFAPGSSAAAPPAAVVHSRLAPYVIGASRVITELAPRELKDEFHTRYEQVKRAWHSRNPDLEPQRN
jgi:membrane protein required for colicin V production